MVHLLVGCLLFLWFKEAFGLQLKEFAVEAITETKRMYREDRRAVYSILAMMLTLPIALYFIYCLSILLFS